MDHPFVKERADGFPKIKDQLQSTEQEKVEKTKGVVKKVEPLSYKERKSIRVREAAAL